jgi:hypothetical protein
VPWRRREPPGIGLPALDDLAVGESVDDQLLGTDPAAGGSDAVEGSGVRSLPDQARGDRVALDHQLLQVPAVVREGGGHSLAPVDVCGPSVDGSGPAHLLGDELAQLIEPVLVAAGEVVLVSSN